MKRKETKFRVDDPQCEHPPLEWHTPVQYKAKLAEYKKTQDLGVKGFTWRTMRDNQVCDKCLARDGKHYAWGDLPSDELPGMHPGCRCYADSDVDEAFDALCRDKN